MAIILGIVALKGGVGKSSLARLLAREIAAKGKTVKIGDLDFSQQTSADWHRLRLSQNVNPPLSVEAYASVSEAMKQSFQYDYFIFDSPARASKATLEIAKISNLVIQPVGASSDDLRPGIRLFHELKAAGIPPSKMFFALCRIASEAEALDAKDYIEASGYSVLEGFIPEKIAYRSAQSGGRALSETPFPTLNDRAQKLISDILKRFNKDVQTGTPKEKPIPRSPSANR